jgi:hypothetical protein
MCKFRVGVGGGLGSPLAGFSPNKEIMFLMISPCLHDFWPVILLIFSPLETADFLMLFTPSGDGYSLLCSKKQSPRYIRMRIFLAPILNLVLFHC